MTSLTQLNNTAKYYDSRIKEHKAELSILVSKHAYSSSKVSGYPIVIGGFIVGFLSERSVDPSSKIGLTSRHIVSATVSTIAAKL